MALLQAGMRPLLRSTRGGLAASARGAPARWYSEGSTRPRPERQRQFTARARRAVLPVVVDDRSAVPGDGGGARPRRSNCAPFGGGEANHYYEIEDAGDRRAVRGLCGPARLAAGYTAYGRNRDRKSHLHLPVENSPVCAGSITGGRRG